MSGVLVAEWLDRAASTNTLLLDALRDGSLRPPRLLAAREQTAGRGRLGRAWQSARDGSLCASIAWRFERADLSGLSIAVGIALAEALEARAATPRVGLKWPNDLCLVDAAAPLGYRKLGGILIEAVGRTAVIGIGLNVAPIEVGPSSGGFACWREIEPDAEPRALLDRLAPPLAAALARFDARGLDDAWHAAFARRDVLAGRALRAAPTSHDAAPGSDTIHRARSAGETALGTAIGLAADGALRVRRDDGSTATIVSGEVSVRPVEAARC